MPVPVPFYSKEPAHRVIKINQSVDPDHQPSVFDPLTQSLPLPPRGPPPSFATREEWISSLPLWRRNKPRRIWEEDSAHFPQSVYQGFEEGLTVADNAAVIKGTPAQACIPPISTLLASVDLALSWHSMEMHMEYEDIDEEMSVYSGHDHSWHHKHNGHVSDASPANYADYEDMEGNTDYRTDTHDFYGGVASKRLYPGEAYERGAFTPVFEDMSPEPAIGYDPVSSPLGPATPFHEFVDKAVAGDQAFPGCEDRIAAQAPREARYGYPDDTCGDYCQQCQRYDQADQQILPAAPEPVVAPTATITYKKLADPLAEWIASYVWRVCTTGMSLSSTYAQPMAFVKHYPSVPPSHLASSTHSMLLSTLLQPSAVFLALWYIVRLPVFFGPVNLDRELHRKEIRFRAELLGEAHLSYDRDAVESYAPFRLILLGCMLANKWLDDHTFSNKTWHTISNVPIQSINKLESLALDIFRYDLVISPCDWTDWISHLFSYHSSLNSSSCPQPISRPSTSPHTLVRKAIESLAQAGVPALGSRRCGDEACITCPVSPPEPIFVGIEENKMDRRGMIETFEEGVDMLEIDLDEDGPLREEYLPRRRVSGAGSMRHRSIRETVVEREMILPPPARWSPEADEPVTPRRGALQVPRQYHAPQPVAHMALVPPPQPSSSFHQVLDPPHPIWLGLYPSKHEQRIAPEQGVSAMYHPPPSYVNYEHTYPAITGHSRSQSLSYNQAIAGQAHSRLRSFSQACFDPGYSDVRLSENHIMPPPPVMSRWSPTRPTTYPPFYDRPFDCHPRPLKV